MTYIEAIKEGFRQVHKNWQLILMRLIGAVLNCLGFFVIVGVPLTAAIIMLGISIEEITRIRELLDTIKDPTEIIKNYLSITFIIVLSLTVYLLFAYSVWIYVFGASAGVLGNSIKDASSRFSFGMFMSEGKRLFFPITGYTILISFIFLGIALLLSMLGGIITTVSESFIQSETTFGLFLRVLFALTFLTLGLLITFALFTIMIQGVSVLVFDRDGVITALKKAYRFLNSHPSAIYLYGIVYSGYVGVHILLVVFGYPLKFMPEIGTLLSLPYQLISYIVRIYFFLVALASALVYYRHTTSGDSTLRSDTSEEAPLQEPPPLQSDESRQALY
jgi:hypothetical protein